MSVLIDNGIENTCAGDNADDVIAVARLLVSVLIDTAMRTPMCDSIRSCRRWTVIAVAWPVVSVFIDNSNENTKCATFLSVAVAGPLVSVLIDNCHEA